MKTIQILGTGCPKCKKLAARAEQAISELGLSVDVQKVTDIMDITSYGVMMTPALGIDGVIKSVGKVLSVAQIKEFMTQETQK